MACNCNEPKKYEISLGCCVPVIADARQYYTKYQVDKLIESATTSGCCITSEEVDERIASAKTEIEAEIPSLSAYSTTEEMNTVINQSVSGKANASDVQALSGEVQTISGDLQTLSAEVQTIIISGVSGISSAECQSMIDSSISGKLDTSIFQPFSASVETSLGNKQDTSGMTAYTQDTAFTAHTADTTVHVTSTEKNTWNNKSDFSGNYNDLTNKPTIPSIWSGTKAQYDAIGIKDPNTIYLIQE